MQDNDREITASKSRSVDFPSNMQVGGTAFDDSYDVDYADPKYIKSFANREEDENYDMANADFESPQRRIRQYDPELDMVENLTKNIQQNGSSSISVPPIPPPSPVHMYSKLTPSKVPTKVNDVGDTARSVDRGNMTSTSALYNIDPTILQTFADALTPDKTMEIKKLRKKLKEATSSLQVVRGELIDLRTSLVDLSNSKVTLEAENKELKAKLQDKTNALHDFNNHKIEMQSYLKTHTEFFGSVQNTIKGLFLHETLYHESMNNLTQETEKRQRLEAELSETLHELNETRTKLKSKEKLCETQNKELEKLRDDLQANMQLLKEYDNVTELSRMKNELRKMREKSMNLKNMQNILQSQRIKYFELQKDYKELENQHDRLKELLANWYVSPSFSKRSPADTNSKNDELRIKLIREKDTPRAIRPERHHQSASKSRSERMHNSHYPTDPAHPVKTDSIATDKNRIINGIREDIDQASARSNPSQPPTGPDSKTNAHSNSRSNVRTYKISTSPRSPTSPRTKTSTVYESTFRFSTDDSANVFVEDVKRFLVHLSGTQRI